MAYGTDGELAALGLVALCDDKAAQVVYGPAPVLREAVAAEHPEIAAWLDPVFASLTLETLQELNARIAVGGEDAAAVARDYLKSKHFLP
jgi:osmoprotectant transport system substrate-binding protein